MFHTDTIQNRYLKMVHGAIESGWREANRLFSDNRAPPFGQLPKKPQKCSVIIIGAGMAGLGAARELVAAGINDIIILEAQEKAGGRVCTVPLENGHIELGAQWIHGEDNPIYHIAHKQNLLSNTTSAEGLGPYLKTDGTEICSSLVAHISHKISGFLEDCEKFVACDENYPSSVGQYLRDRFEEYLETCSEDTPEDRQTKWSLFEWHLRFQEIDNSCSDLNSLSAKHWGKYLFTGGEDYINLLNGYSSVVDALTQDLPDHIIHFNSPIKKVVWKKKLSAISLNRLSDDFSSFPSYVVCEDGSIVHGMHVIVTCSIGYLKVNLDFMFEPSLPSNLTSAIDSMGFGVVDKVFLVYETPWWGEERQAVQIVRSPSDEVSTAEVRDWWLKDCTGFDVLSRDPPILLAWVGGEGAVFMEHLDDDEIAEHCTNLLQRCVPKLNIPAPKHIKRSCWSNNPYIKGGYSHTTVARNKTTCGRKDLTIPVYCEVESSHKHPVILLAGEAAHESHYSTVHGAFESGQSQARALILYQKEMKSYQTGLNTVNNDTSGNA